VRWFRRPQRPGTTRAASHADRDHLEAWAKTRRGVEAYLEPRTTVTETTVMLIDATGEWTRRRVPSHEVARGFAKRIGIPCYDVALTGYPQRKRDYDARRSAGARAPSGRVDEGRPAEGPRPTRERPASVPRGQNAAAPGAAPDDDWTKPRHDDTPSQARKRATCARLIYGANHPGTDAGEAAAWRAKAESLRTKYGL
jgi:hypothetical protein